MKFWKYYRPRKKAAVILLRVLSKKIALSNFFINNKGSLLEFLSDRELQVAQMIFDYLDVSPRTVSTYHTCIFNKLNTRNCVEWVHLFVRYNVLNMG